MKMKTLFLLSSLFLTHVIHAQITKSYWLVGGSGSFSSTGNNRVGGNKESRVQVAGDIGYFVVDKLALGLKPGFFRLKNRGDFGVIKVNTYNIGPFVRYYFLSPEKALNLFTELGYDFGKNTSNNLESRSFNEFLGTAGVAAFFNSSVALEFTLGYSSFGYNTSGRTNSVLAGIGFHYHCKRNKKI
jgi:hypothetical protein